VIVLFADKSIVISAFVDVGDDEVALEPLQGLQDRGGESDGVRVKVVVVVFFGDCCCEVCDNVCSPCSQYSCVDLQCFAKRVNVGVNSDSEGSSEISG
jgi:hypothetical protein